MKNCLRSITAFALSTLGYIARGRVVFPPLALGWAGGMGPRQLATRFSPCRLLTFSLFQVQVPWRSNSETFLKSQACGPTPPGRPFTTGGSVPATQRFRQTAFHIGFSRSNTED